MSKDKMWNNDLTRRSFLRVFGLAAAPLVIGGVSGCRPTDTLTKNVYADWATDVDYDSPTKSLVNKPDKDPTTSLPKLYKTKSEAVEEEVQTPEKQDETKQDKQTPEAEHDDKADGDAKVKKGSKEKASDSKEKTDKELDSAGRKKASVGGNEVGKDASKDATDEPELSGSVIAFGEMANIVLLLGGKGALWAADDEFLKAAKSMYPTATIKSVESGLLSSYNANSSTMPNKQFKQLCARLDKLKEDERPVYVIYDGGVGCPLTDDESALLKKRYKIETKYFFLSNVSYLKNSMNWIKKALAGGSGFEKKPSEQYDAYWDFHDTLLKDVGSCNGGAAIWSDARVPSIDFSTGRKSKLDAVDQDKLMWTLLIDQWDKRASYSYKNVASSLKSSNGLGVCTLGYDWSPVSYYLQRAGVLNNAAARYQNGDNNFKNQTYYRYVWQFDMKYGQPSTLKNIRTIKNGSLTSEDDQINRSAEGDILLRAQDGSCGLGKHGNAQFPAVIVASSDAKKRMERDRNGKGVYAPHYLEAGSTGNNANNNAMGLPYASNKASKKALWRAYVGREGDVDEESCEALEAYATKPANAYDVLLNPHGVYCNWIRGSVESVLEAAWAYEAIVAEHRDGASSLSTSYGNSAESVVAKFYETFYGKSPNTSKILKGGYAS